MVNHRFTLHSWCATLLGAAALVTLGCAEPGNSEPHYHLNSQGDNRDNYQVAGGEDEAERKDKEFNINGRQYLADALEAMFGTPDHPYVFKETGLDLKKIRMASGPAGGLPSAEQKAALAELKKNEATLKKLQPEQDAEAKKRAADILTHLTSFAASKSLTNVKTPADLKDQEAAFREQYKAAFEAQAAAEKNLGETTGALADLDMEIKSFSVQQKGLYRKHCAHCHGTTGDGAGPTAAFLNPYPRDYRQGVFKFKATERASRPSTEDLRRILLDGINDTAMPSFALLPPDEVEALVEYVKYLGIRGEAESAMRDRLFGDRKEMKPSRSELVKVALKPIIDVWKESDTQLITPVEGYKPEGEHVAWLKSGESLFMGDKAKCFSCHGVTALGDGRKKSEPVYDIWNKDKAKAVNDLKALKEKSDADAKEVARLTNVVESYALPVQAQQPRNLRLGRYRFGRNKLDIYRRIYAGINGTEMPGAGPPTPGAKGTLTEQEIWQLVDYVLSLPYDLNPTAPAADHGKAHAANEPHAHPAAGQTAGANRPAGR